MLTFSQIFIPIGILLSFVAANTETFVLLIPNYYDIPIDQRDHTDPHLAAINASTSVLTNHPILNANNYNVLETLVSLPYDYLRKPRQRLFVKLTNYNNNTFDANDLINVKLCWPATMPFNFDLNYRFVRAHELGAAEKSLTGDTLDIYIVVDYEADFYAVREVDSTMIDFNLVISKLPNRVPIPIELYDVIVYVVDVCIVLAGVFPYILGFLEKQLTGVRKRD